MQDMSISPANDNRVTAAASGDIKVGDGTQVEARGQEIVRLHQTLRDWRDLRRLAYAEGWLALAARLIEIEIRALEQEIARQVRELF